MTGAELRERAPLGEPLTDYDRDHATLYLRLLDAEAEGADWQEVARLLFRIDPSVDRFRAELMYATHLARAQWLRDSGYKELFSNSSGQAS
jgi:hypothetical protein